MIDRILEIISKTVLGLRIFFISLCPRHAPIQWVYANGIGNKMSAIAGPAKLCYNYMEYR